MTKNKNIWSYFDDNVEYPKDVAHNTLPYGTIWCYISSTFLNGLVNYVKPISCFVIDRYTSPQTVISNEHGRKSELIKSIIEGKKVYHTNLHMFQDDFIILSKIENEENDGKGRYMFFWFDCDVSDCCIGKFETEDDIETVKNSVKLWLDERKFENKDLNFEVDMDNGILDYSELPVSFLSGWLKF